MLAIYSNKTNYTKGGSFPLVTIPQKLEGEQSLNFSDFQWWCYSEDFQKWLNQNPRQWTAESNSAHSGDFQIFEDKTQKDKKVLNFSDHSNIKVFENEVEKVADSNLASNYVQFHFAYNKLLSEGKISNSLNFSSESGDIAAFVILKDDEGKLIDQTLTAYRMAAKQTGSDNLALVDVTETLPGGPLPQDSDASSILGVISDNALQIAAWGAIGLTVFGAIKSVGSGALLFSSQIIWHRRLMKAIKSSQTASKAIKTTSLWGGIWNLLTLKNTRAALKTGSRFARAAKGAKISTRAYRFLAGMRTSFRLGARAAKATGQAAKAAKAGTQIGAKLAAKASARTGSRFIPFVGEVLMVIDAVGSSWNWLKNSQAPTYREVKSTPGMYNAFVPKDIEIGRPITVCYSQGSSGGLGAVLDVFVSTEKRTTMELIKIKQDGSGSLFIVTKINSEFWAKELANHELFLLRFPVSTNVKHGWIDNDDLKPMGCFFDNISEAANVPTIFYGYCSWSDLTSAYSASERQLIKADPEAPDTFDFNFKDTEGNALNVSGKKISSETLSKLTEEELQIVFGITEVGKNSVSENLESRIFNKVLEGKDILKFGQFNRNVIGIFEEEETEGGDYVKLTPEQKSGSAVIAAYNITKKEYANPDLRGKKGYGLGQFEHFLIGDAAYSLSEGSPLEVAINTDELLEDCRVGKAEYEEPEKDDTEETEVPLKADQATVDARSDVKDTKSVPTEYKSEPKSPEYDVKASPNDLNIKSNRRSTVITDSPVPGGVNIVDKFLTTSDKQVMGISDWDNITSAKVVYDRSGEITKVKLRNKYSQGDRKKIFDANDGRSFEIAKRFVEEARDRIKIE